MRKSLICALVEKASDLKSDEMDHFPEGERDFSLVEMLRLAAKQLEKYHDQTLIEVKDD